MHLVKKINYIDGYKISLTFNDKKTKLVDIEPYLDKGVFLPLRDPAYFNTVRLSGNTIVWPNEADFCHDVLYEIGKDVEKITKKSTPRKKRYIPTIKTETKPSIVAKSKH
jgi:Protein of unknown function (DUF2442)